MKKLLPALGILALAACYSSAPPPQQPAAPQQPWVPTPPVYALIGERQELNLTSVQVTALDSIGVALAASNNPALTQIQALQPSGGFRRTSAADVEKARPLIDSIRENNRRAQEAVRTLLTEQQRADVCKMYAPDRAEQRRRENAQRQAREMPRGRFESDTVMAASIFSGPWSFCNRQRGTAADSIARAARPDTVRRTTP
ncbi:MAG: hypothetical protein ABW277_17235 [Longimicrobiaceae bacterium]